jgi:hypothetical protein
MSSKAIGTFACPMKNIKYYQFTLSFEFPILFCLGPLPYQPFLSTSAFQIRIDDSLTTSSSYFKTFMLKMIKYCPQFNHFIFPLLQK